MSSDQIGEPLDVVIPDVIEPIIAYRSWIWNDQGIASQRETEWLPGVPLKAECKPATVLRGLQSFFGTAVMTPNGDIKIEYPPTPAPCSVSPADPVDEDPLHGEFGCGIYAYRTIEEAWAELHGLSAHRYILGEVQLWGRVWPHEHGYRAEYAKPIAFYRFLGPKKESIFEDPVDVLARHYGVEVKDIPLPQDERERIAKREEERYMASLSASPWATTTPLTMQQVRNMVLAGGDDPDDTDDTHTPAIPANRRQAVRWWFEDRFDRLIDWIVFEDEDATLRPKWQSYGLAAAVSVLGAYVTVSALGAIGSLIWKVVS